MKRVPAKLISSFSAAALAATMVVVPVSAQAAPQYAAPASASLEGQTAVVYTGNLHGDVDAMAKAAQLKQDYEAAGADAVLVDTGNFYQGTKYTAATRGKIATQSMAAAGYDAVAIGTREFYYGNGALGAKPHGDYKEMGTIAQNLEAAEIEGVSSNVTGTNANFALVPSATEGTVGFVALTDPATPDTVLEDSIAGLSFGEGTAAAEQQASALKASENAPKHVVALANLGSEPAIAGADAVINTPEGTEEQAGVVVFDIEGKATKTEIDLASVSANSAVAGQIDALQAAVDEEYPASVDNSVVLEGRSAYVRGGETNTGDLWTDALVWFANHDETAQAGLKEHSIDADHIVAVWNGGNLRDFIYPGQIILQDVERTLPYPNQVHIVYLTGSQLLETLESAYQALPYDANDSTNVARNAAFLNVSGLNCAVDTDAEYAAGDEVGSWFRAKEITRTAILDVNGKPFDADATYAVVTSNAIANGMDSNYVIKDLAEAEQLQKTTTSTKVTQAVWSYITSADALNGKLDAYSAAQGRISAVVPLSAATVSAKTQTYTGKALEPAVTVKLDGKTLAEGTDYTAAYSANTNVGTATVTVTGKGAYKGTATGTFQIVAPVVKASEVKKIAVGKKKMTVTLKKVSGATAYKVSYRVKGTSKWAVKTVKKTKLTISKLKKGKTYQVKVVTQKTVGKKTFSSRASATATSKKIK